MSQQTQTASGREKALEARRQRVLKHLAAAGDAPVVEGVTPLNPGFFRLERMRRHAVAATKQRTAVRKNPGEK